MNQVNNNVALDSAVLAIKAGSNADAKSNAFLYRIGGEVYKSAALATIDLSASSGTLALADDNVACIAVDINAAGTVSTTVGTHVASTDIADAKQPLLAADKARIGYIFVLNETASAFTIGTTVLDVANSTVMYVNCFNHEAGAFQS